jgi:hypothetical protein
LDAELNSLPVVVDNDDIRADAVLRLVEEEAERIAAQDAPQGLQFAPPSVAAARTAASTLEKRQRAAQCFEQWRAQKARDSREIAAKLLEAKRAKEEVQRAKNEKCAKAFKAWLVDASARYSAKARSAEQSSRTAEFSDVTDLPAAETSDVASIPAESGGVSVVSAQPSSNAGQVLASMSPQTVRSSRVCDSASESLLVEEGLASTHHSLLGDRKDRHISSVTAAINLPQQDQAPSQNTLLPSSRDNGRSLLRRPQMQAPFMSALQRSRNITTFPARSGRAVSQTARPVSAASRPLARSTASVAMFPALSLRLQRPSSARHAQKKSHFDGSSVLTRQFEGANGINRTAESDYVVPTTRETPNKSQIDGRSRGRLDASTVAVGCEGHVRVDAKA